jgi:Mn2+/Fe2+ NRAMP family transporter
MAQAQSNVGGMIMPKISYASTMIVEDHLKKLLTSTSNKPFKVADNKLLPRS